MRYDYRCPVCGREEEREVPVEGRDEQFCGCGAKLKRLLSRPYIRIPRAFRLRPDWEQMLTPAGQKVIYGASRRELEREYFKAIEEWQEAKVPEYIKRQVEEEERFMREWEKRQRKTSEE